MVRAITQIVRTNGLGGTQLGLWFSWGQLGDQFVDDDADTHSLAARAIPAVEQCAPAQRVVACFTGAAASCGHCISGQQLRQPWLWRDANYAVKHVVELTIQLASSPCGPSAKRLTLSAGAAGARNHLPASLGVLVAPPDQTGAGRRKTRLTVALEIKIS